MEVKLENKHIEYIEQLKSTKFTVESLNEEMKFYRSIINELNSCLKKDNKTYVKCAVLYKLYSLFISSYNEGILHELNSLKEEVKYEKSCLKLMRKILKNTNIELLQRNMHKYYEILVYLINLHNIRYDYFEYISELDTMHFKKINYIPSNEVKNDNKELKKKINNSINLIMEA